MEITKIKPSADITNSAVASRDEEPPIKHLYLTYLSIVLMFASAIHFGWGDSDNGQVGFVVREKFGWPRDLEDGGIVDRVTMLTLINHVGGAIGSQIAGSYASKFGLRKVLIGCNLLGVFSTFFKILEQPWSLFLGRFLYGISGGASTFCMIKAFNDSLPPRVS